MIKDIPNLVETITKEIKEFTDVAVIGLSGGADSTLVAILCKMALGKENVHGVSMPANRKDDNTSNDRSYRFTRYTDINDLYSSIEYPLNIFLSELNTTIIDKEDKLLEGNIKARLRMTVLYAYCEALGKKENKKCRVIGTGNLSEDFIGYATKYGDLGVDINPIGDLFKSEVYQLLDYFKDEGIILEEHIDRVPSAGLWEGQTDEEELGFTYDEMESVIKNMITVGGSGTILDSEVYEFVKERRIDNLHKLITPSSINLRKFCDD